MEHQTVVVTGASAGIGRATARLFGERGWSVGLIARGQEGLYGAAREVEEAGGKALAVSADVADYEQVDVFALGAEVDTAHAGSMLALAAVDPAARHAALTDTLAEALFAAAGFSCGRAAGT